jgi:diguanylate cyclase (GGDEF)-like protein
VVSLEAAQRANAEFRFHAATMEQQASRLADLVEAAHEHAQQAEKARALLATEIEERQALEARLRVLASTDGLTGASNRAAFLADAQREVERVCRSGEDLPIMMIDVDYFKAINDRHGHAGGDQALRHLVGILRSGTRTADLLGRLGGEEFALVLPDTSAEDAAAVAERLRILVTENPAVYHDQ